MGGVLSEEISDSKLSARNPKEATEKGDAADVGEERAKLTDALERDTLCLAPSDQIGFRKFDPKRVRIDPYKPNRARTRRRARLTDLAPGRRATGDGP